MCTRVQVKSNNGFGSWRGENGCHIVRPIKRAFRRAVEQRSPEPGEACVAMLEEALGRTGAA